MSNILIVEDNFMIADQVEETLLRNGYEVCGIAASVAEGLALYREHKPDLVIVDLRLGRDELGTEMVAQLQPLGDVGILYVTGSGCEIALSTADGHACLSKPYVAADILRSLQLVFDLVNTGTAARPYPRGFYLLNPAEPATYMVQA